MLAVETAAFATPAEAELVAALLADPKARPTVSLLAEAHGVAVGHILLTGARVSGDGATVAASILAPLAVVPEAQRRGVGQALIHAGIAALTALDVGLVFVLGIPTTIRARAFARRCRWGCVALTTSTRQWRMPGWCARHARGFLAR